MVTISASLALCAGNSPVTSEFPAQRPVTRSFDVFFHLCLNKRLSKQSWVWWFVTSLHQSWRHSDNHYYWWHGFMRRPIMSSNLFLWSVSYKKNFKCMCVFRIQKWYIKQICFPYRHATRQVLKYYREGSRNVPATLYQDLLRLVTIVIPSFRNIKSKRRYANWYSLSRSTHVCITNYLFKFLNMFNKMSFCSLEFDKCKMRLVLK